MRGFRRGMNKNQAERSQKINLLMQQLNSVLAVDKVPERHEWILWVMDKFSCSARTAREYVEVAFMRLGIKHG